MLAGSNTAASQASKVSFDSNVLEVDGNTFSVRLADFVELVLRRVRLATFFAGEGDVGLFLLVALLWALLELCFRVVTGMFVFFLKV